MKNRKPVPMLMLVPAAPAAAAPRPPPATWGPKNEEEFVDLFMYLLRGPVVVMPGWEDSFRDRWDEVVMNRLLHGRNVFAEQMCTEYEAMLYVSSATLVAPPSYRWFQIYLWLFHRGKPELAQAEGLVPDHAELNVNQQEDLAALRRWIFQRQMLHLKQKDRPAKEVEAKRKELEATQPKLF